MYASDKVQLIHSEMEDVIPSMTPEPIDVIIIEKEVPSKEIYTSK